MTAACGAPPPPQRPAAVTSSQPPAPPATTPAAGARPGGAAPAADRPRTPAPAATGEAVASPEDAEPPLPSGLPSSAPLRVELGSACLAPGATQRLVVETLPHAFVAFDNLYPDNRTGAVHGGAEARGRADADGRFTAVWRVAPDTPAGRVRVDVGVSARAGSAITMAYYRLAASCS